MHSLNDLLKGVTGTTKKDTKVLDFLMHVSDIVYSIERKIISVHKGLYH